MACKALSSPQHPGMPAAAIAGLGSAIGITLYPVVEIHVRKYFSGIPQTIDFS